MRLRDVAHVEVYRSLMVTHMRVVWRWRLRAGNGRIVAASTTGWEFREAAELRALAVCSGAASGGLEVVRARGLLRSQRWVWRWRDGGGDLVAWSGEGYRDRSVAESRGHFVTSGCYEPRLVSR